jgi:hypothetical protein
MTRILLTVLLPLLLPTLLYVVWLATARPAHEAHPPGSARRLPLPWPWLLAAGIGLVALLLYRAEGRIEGVPDGVYVPPKYIDGKVVPGHLVPAVPDKP